MDEQDRGKENSPSVTMEKEKRRLGKQWLNVNLLMSTQGKKKSQR